MLDLTKLVGKAVVDYLGILSTLLYIFILEFVTN